MAQGGYRPGAGRKKEQRTIMAEKAKEELIRVYLENIVPINEALVKKAKEGDIQAIKELHDRVYGRPAQPLVGDKDNPIIIQGVEIKTRK